jgi:3-phosphoshikimate 1-carboxyvinyltransferase
VPIMSAKHTDTTGEMIVDRRVGPARNFRGSLKLPGDKSISHRGLIFGALSQGRTEVHHILESADVQSTARVLGQLGVPIRKEGHVTIIDGRGPESFINPTQILDCGNSGTTMRLMMGVLSAVDGLRVEMTGDESLIKRPMGRVADPLREMGAQIELTGKDFAPLKVLGRRLHGIDYELKIASAQIKTAIILAGLLADGDTRIRGEIHSRDHTERLLKHFGVHIESNSEEVRVRGGQQFSANILRVPGDPSTAAFWLAAAVLVPQSDLHLHGVSLNPTRTGFIEVLRRMGATIRVDLTEKNPEPMGDIQACHGKLVGVVVEEDEIPSLIDELPILAVLATQAHGTTKVTGAEELRVKETDRIEAVATNLRAMGAVIETTRDGFIIEGPQKLIGAEINSFHDHRIAMAFSVAALIAEGESLIRGSDCVGISYPEFYSTLQDLTK